MTRGTTGEYWKKALIRAGHSVETFDLMQASRWKTIESNKFLGRISTPLGRNIDICNIIKKAKNKLDLIIEIEADRRHLSGYKKLTIPKVFYGIDTHLAFNFHRNIIKDFDIAFVAQKECYLKLKRFYEGTYWLPLAADPETHRRYNVSKLFDIGYVGSLNANVHSERMRLLNKLGVEYSVLCVQNIFMEDMAKVYSLSKIGFNKSIKGDLNMRVFEVMSCGSMLITDKIENGLNDFFENKKHLVLYENEEDLMEEVRYYLENEEDREKIAIVGQKEVHRKHTYDKRVEKVMETVKKI